MATLDKIYFTSPEQIKALYPVSDNVDEKWINPAIIISINRIRKLLGTPLMDNLRASIRDSKVILSATQANPAVIATTQPHGLLSGDTFGIDFAGGMDELDGFYTATAIGSPTSVTIGALDSLLYQAYQPGTARLYAMNALRWELLLKVRRLHAMATIKEMLFNHSVRIANAGVVKIAEMGSGGQSNIQQTNTSLVMNMINSWDSKANDVESEIKVFICDNSQEFTDYLQSGAPVERRGSTGTGFYFAG